MGTFEGGVAYDPYTLEPAGVGIPATVVDDLSGAVLTPQRPVKTTKGGAWPGFEVGGDEIRIVQVRFPGMEPFTRVSKEALRAAGVGGRLTGSAGTYEDLPESGKLGDAYVVGEDLQLVVWDGAEFVARGSMRGPAGPGATDPVIAALVNDLTDTRTAVEQVAAAAVATMLSDDTTQAWAAVQEVVDTRAVPRGELVLSLMDPQYGAVYDPIADNTAAISALLSDAASRSGAVAFIPGGWWKHGPLSMATSGVSLRGESDRSSILENTGVGAGITLGGASVGVASLHFADLTLRNTGSAGHLMEVPHSFSQSRFERVRMISTNPGASLFYCHRAATTGGVFDTIWDGGYYKMPVSSTAHGFHLIGPGSPANLLKWVGGRYEGGGTYFFHMEAGATAYCYGNSWDGLNAEFPDHGFIRILSGMGNTITALGVQDCGTIDADLVHLGKGSGPQTRGTTIIGYNRSKGTLTDGAVDIHNVAGGNAGSLTLAGVTGPQAAGVTVDLGAGSGWATLLGVDSAVTVLNQNVARTVVMDPSRGLQVPSVLVSGVPVLSGASEPEGVVTAGVGALYLCTSVTSGLPKVWEKRTGSGGTGWRTAGDGRALPGTAFQSVSHYVNTTGKYAGAAGFDTTIGRPVWAAGATAASPWRFADGSTAHTPV